jgi:hypothetical protein
MAQPDSQHGRISGEWSGSYTSDKLPRAERVVLMFQQLTREEFEASRYAREGETAPPGETVVGTYKSENGAIGTMAGSIINNLVTLTATQMTPTCPGSFEMKGTLTGDLFTWGFKGKDCLGDETGKGEATRIR